MHRGKGMKFVGDSRIKAETQKFKPKDYSEYPGKTEAFWPNFLLKEWLAGSVFLIGFLCLTLAHPVPLEDVADPNAAGYIPLPDWYFLFLYQLLKYEFASGPYFVIGAVVIPGLAFGALLLAPFLDNRSPSRNMRYRPIASSLMIIGILSVMWLTWEAADEVDWAAKAEAGIPPEMGAEITIDTEHEGYAIYENNCMSCHGENLEGSAAAPGLIGIDRTEEEIADIAVNGIGDMPAGQFDGSEEELQQLAEFIVQVNEQNEGSEGGGGGGGH